MGKQLKKHKSAITNYTTFPGNGIIIPSYSEYRALGNKPINLGTIGLSGCTVIAIEIHYEDKILLWISHILSSINKDTVNNIKNKIEILLLILSYKI